MSRDSFSFFPDGTGELVGYVARQSWISASSDARALLKEYEPLDSQFQQRMVTGDAKGDALDRCVSLGSRSDVILMDLIDERGGVVHVDDTLFVTYLSELRRAAPHLLADSARIRIIPFGSDEHFALWSEAARHIVSTLREHKLLERVVCLVPHWARYLDDGTPFEGPAHLMGADEADAAYTRYYAFLAELGMSLLTIPQALCRTTQTHQWGVNYFHYVDRFYEYVAKTLLSHPEE